MFKDLNTVTPRSSALARSAIALALLLVTPLGPAAAQELGLEIPEAVDPDTPATGGFSLGWIASLGSGYSGIAIDDGKAFTLFTAGDKDVMAAFSTESGDELWRYEIGPYYAGHDGSHDGPIATPAASAGTVCGMAPRGELFCLEADSGAERWRVDLTEKYAAEKPWYGMSSTPLIVDGRLVVEFTVEGESSIAAFALADGERLWSAGGDEIAYQSPIVLEVGGERQILAVGNEYLYGIDPETGAVAWEYAHGGDGSAIGSGSLQPVPAGDGRLLLMHKRDESKLVQLNPGEEGAVEVVELWTSPAIRNSYTPPVYSDGYFYGYSNRFLTSVDAETGDAVWRSREPGDGFLAILAGKLGILTKKGTLHLVDLSPEGYQERNRYELFRDPAWTAPLSKDGSLYVRSMGNIARMDLTGAMRGPGGIEVPESMKRSFFWFMINGAMASEDPAGTVESFTRTIDVAPLREGNNALHFVYMGEADDMALVSDLTGSRHEQPMMRIPGVDFFWYSTVVDPAARFTYHFVKDFEEEIVDPLNPRTVEIDGETRSWHAMPGFEEPAYLNAEAEQRGRVERFELQWPGHDEASPVDVYLPHGYDGGEEGYPVLYVHDGEDAMEQGGLVASLDNLIEAGSVQPLIAVFIHAPEEDFQNTTAEERWSRYADAVAGPLVTEIDRRFRTVAAPESRAALGAGWEAARALYTALSHDAIGSVALHSTYFMTSGEKLLDSVLADAAEHPLKLYVDWGEYDIRAETEAWNMPESNRALVEKLESAGYEIQGGQVPQGGGWHHWKTRIGDSLAALFPGASEDAAGS